MGHCSRGWQDGRVTTPKLLRRSVTDARVAGVCGGIAERYRIDPLLVRVTAIIAVLSSGIGLVLYAAAWLLVPRGTERPVLARVFPSVARVRGRTWAVVVGIAAIAVLVVVGGAFDVSLMPTMVVLGILYASQLRPGTKNSAPAARRPTATPAPAPRQPRWPLLPPATNELIITTPAGPWRPTNRWGQLLSAGECAAYFSIPDPVGLYDRRPPAAPQHRSRVLAVVAGLAIAAFFAMLSLLGAFVEVQSVTYLATGLILVGLALVVGAFVGRPRGFIAIATVLMLIAGFTTADASTSTTSTSDTYLTVRSSDDLPQQASYTGSDYTLDLSELVVDSNTTTTVSVTGGNAVVILPMDGNYSLSWSVMSGQVTLPDGSLGETSGSQESVPSPGRPTATITIDVFMGDLVIS